MRCGCGNPNVALPTRAADHCLVTVGIRIMSFVIYMRHNYVVCEIGNYYGYDDFELGAGRIIIKHMENLKGNSLLPLYSIDTLPLLDERKLDKLVVSLNSILN